MIRNTNLPCLVVHLLYAVQTGDHTHPKTHLLPWGTQTWPQQGTQALPQTGKYFESLITKSPVSHNKSPYLKLALSIPHLCTATWMPSISSERWKGNSPYTMLNTIATLIVSCHWDLLDISKIYVSFLHSAQWVSLILALHDMFSAVTKTFEK